MSAPVFIELVDDLRCPRPHDETWLVASADRTVDRDIIEGTLGCPVCHAEYPIRAGAVWFGEPPRRSSAPVDEQYAPPELATRIAAFLNLVDPPGFALLVGAWSEVAPFLKDVVPTHVVVLSPTTHVDSRNGISVVHVAEGIPFGDASCRGVALDDSYATSEGIAAAVRVLAQRGRLVAPARASLPAGVTELARDDRLWVAERAASPPQLVTLRAREPGR